MEKIALSIQLSMDRCQNGVIILSVDGIFSPTTYYMARRPIANLNWKDGDSGVCFSSEDKDYLLIHHQNYEYKVIKFGVWRTSPIIGIKNLFCNVDRGKISNFLECLGNIYRVRWWSHDDESWWRTYVVKYSDSFFRLIFYSISLLRFRI